MSTSGRTVWWAKDAGWWRREYVVELGEEYGPAGPAVLDWLACEAAAQNDGGFVKTGYRSIARGCFIDDLELVRHVVSRCVTLGSLDELEGDDRRFTARISGWSAEQQRGRAAERKRRQREREAENTSDPPSGVTPGHVSSRPVTPGHEKSPTSHNSRTTPPNPPAGGGDLGTLFPGRGLSGSRRRRDAAQAEREAWAVEHFPGALPRAVADTASFAAGHGWEPDTGADGLREWAERAGGAWSDNLEPKERAA